MAPAPDPEHGPTPDPSPESVVAAFFAAVEAGDIAALDTLYADEAQIWHNFSGVAQGKADNLRVLGWLTGGGTTIRYAPVEQIVMGDRVARRHLLVVTLAGGQVFEIPASIWFTVEHGRVTRIDEYLDAKQSDAMVAARLGR